MELVEVRNLLVICKCRIFCLSSDHDSEVHDVLTRHLEVLAMRLDKASESFGDASGSLGNLSATGLSEPHT